jgi:nitronate monooxygenase
MSHPKIIQGGMGAGVSGWALARAVSLRGQLGVVSGTAIETILARRLQLGDPGGHMRRACKNFPFPKISERVIAQYFIEGGKPADEPFKAVPLFSDQPPRSLTELTVLANFAEVFLAKEGHDGVVGINLLEKIQMPTLPSLFGAMLANVDYVLMGAGIPRVIPGILDDLAEGRPVKMKLDVEDAEPGREFACSFDPQAFCGGTAPVLKRPKFIAIVSSATLAIALARKSTGRVNGFVVEGASAGGHNAPPRGAMQLNAKGEPIYSERDLPDLDKIKALGLPFWLAGSYGRAGKLAEALAAGAAGIQVGTPFAFCRESGIDPQWKQRVIAKSRAAQIEVFTDPVASPTGFPFKVVQMEGTVSEPSIQATRARVCDLGYLRHPYQKPDGGLGYRCPGEAVESYVRKGGVVADTVGRKCVCNGLLATIGLGQIRLGGHEEKPLLTAGDDVARIAEFLPADSDTYSADDVIDSLL